MARRQADGSIVLDDGRVIYANTIVLAQDLCELIPILCPTNLWPITHGRGQGAFFVGAVGAGAPGGAAGGGPGGGGGGGGGGGSGGGATGPQGFQGPAGGPVGPDIFAATRVVDLGGAGTDLTIAGAIAALPPTGGKIFIKQGVYPQAATLDLPDGMSVVFEGASKDSTTITLITPGVPLFRIGALATGQYGFRDFTALGDGASAQAFLDLQAPTDVSVENVDVTSFRDIVDDAAGAEVLFRSCSFTMPAIASCSFWRGTGAFGVLTWLNTEATLPIVTTSAIEGQPDWHVTDSYIGGPAGQSVYGVGVIIWQGFNLDRADVRVARPQSRVVNLYGTDVIIRINNNKTLISNSTFRNAVTFSDHIRIVGDGITDLVEATIVGCTFDGTASPPVRSISTDLIGGPIIDSCIFRGYTSEAILISGGAVSRRVTVSDCRFETPGVTPVAEGPLGTNRYSDNDGFGGSIILSPNSVVDQDNYRNVRTWGALGDGVTDDSPAIQSAIDALHPLGGVVYFPPGRYLLATTLVLPDKPVMLIGAGGSISLPVGASQIDLAGNAIAAFLIPSTAAFLQSYVARDLGFTGTSVAGQHAFQVDADVDLTIDACDLVGIDAIFNCTTSPSCTLLDSLAFPVNSIYLTVGAGSILEIADSLIFVAGAVAISGDPSTHISDTNINAFGAFTMDIGSFSVLNGTRFAGATVNSNGGNSRFEGYASDSSLLDLGVTANNVVSGALIETAAIGINIGGMRNVVDGVRFNAVAVPINEVGAADLNLYDGINGFAGSVIIGGGSVVGTVIA